MTDTDRRYRQLAADLRESGVYYDIFRMSPASIAVLTYDDRRFVDINEGFRKLINYARSHVQGRTFGELGLHYEHENELPALPLSNERKNRTTTWANGHIRRSDGTVRHVLGSFVGFSIEGTDLVAYKLIDVSRFHEAQREVVESMEQEQKRVEQELREHICQQLSGLEYMVAGIRDAITSDDRTDGQTLGEITEMMRQVNRRLRKTVQQMIPTRLLEAGLGPALRHSARALEERHNIRCTVSVEPGAERIDRQASRHIYRMAQDAATIAAERDRISHIHVALRKTNDTLVLSIKTQPDDTHAAFLLEDEEATRAIRYRANLLGGTLATGRSDDGELTERCRVTVPVNEVVAGR